MSNPNNLGLFAANLTVNSGNVVVPISQGGTGGANAVVALNNMSYLGTTSNSVVATARTATFKMGDWVSAADYGFLPGNSGTANQTALQAAINAATPAVGTSSLSAGTVFIPAGQYSITGTVNLVKNTASVAGIPKIMGAGLTATVITQTGGFAIFSATGSNSIGSGNELYMHISDMTLLGPGTTGSRAINGTLVSFTNLENLLIEGMEYGVYLSDIDQSILTRVICRFNTYGMYFYHNTAYGGLGTQPNNINLVSCTIGSNSTYGVQNYGGAGFNIIGGDIEYNGSTIGSTNHAGLILKSPGLQGATGVVCVGVYFEGNKGIADAYIEALYAGNPITPCTSTFVGCTFNRINSASASSRFSTNNICVNWDTIANVGQQILVVDGCGFFYGSGYTASSARPNIGVAAGGLALSSENFYDRGNIYYASVERPSIANNGNMPYTQVAHSTSLTVSANSSSTVTIDSQQNSYRWPTSPGSNAIVIQDAGFYSFSYTAFFSVGLSATTSNDNVLLQILNGTTIIGQTSITSVSNAGAVGQVTAIYNCSANDSITVKIYNNKSVSTTLVGVNTTGWSGVYGASGLIIKRIA